MSRVVQQLGCGIAVLVACVSVAAAPPPRTVTPVGAVRGLWVQRTALASPDSIAAMVQAAASGGFNTLLVQVRGRGEAFYRSGLEPRSSDLDRQPLEFDPLATTIKVARQAGLSVHAWVNVNLVASGSFLPRSPTHVVAQHPDWLMVPRALSATLKKTGVWSPAYLGTLARWTRSQTDQVEGLYVSPVTAEARAYTTSVVAEIASKYELDGIHLDYIRYPSAEFDFSASTLASFRDRISAAESRAERERLDRAAAASPTAWADARPAAWASFHRERLTALLSSIQTAVRTARPGIVVSAAVVGAFVEARDSKYQDWLAWAKAGQIDVACPMLYALSADQFATVTGDIRAALGTVPFWAGIGAYRLPVDATIERVRLARRANADGVLLFSYGQLAEAAAGSPATLSALRPVLLEASNGSGIPR
jgi:uncharacterized lipoprotein YddW (UPF0748 family)